MPLIPAHYEKSYNKQLTQRKHMMTIPDLEEVFETSGGVKIVKWAAKLSQRVIKGKK